MSGSMIQLRAHHLLCIQNYTGHGYDEAFTEHMNQVTASLAKNPEQIIQICEGCDELCSVCPNREEVAANESGKLTGQNAFICNSPDKVEKMDSAVMRICALDIGARLAWQAARQKAKTLILQTEQFEAVCGECSWYELCESIVRHK